VCVCGCMYCAEVGIYMVISTQRNDDQTKFEDKQAGKQGIVGRRQGGEVKLAVSQRRSKKWRG